MYPRSPRAATICLAVGASVLSLLLAACGGSGQPMASPSAGAPSAPSASMSPGSSMSSSPTSPQANGTVIDVQLEDGRVSPNGDKIAISKGQQITVNVTSDHDDEIHVHGFDVEFEVKADTPGSFSFVADQVGSFEMEAHHPEKIIAILNVR